MPVTRLGAKTIVAFFILMLTSAVLADVQQLQSSFQQPPDEAKIMMRWWWFGPAVTHAQLEREMKLMKEGGIGGFEVQPTYPLAVDRERPGLRNWKFMSPEFLDALKFTAAKAKELGLRMDLTLGSGWPYGGPQFSDPEGASAIASQAFTVPAGRRTVTAPKLTNARTQSVVAAFLKISDSEYVELPVADNTASLPADRNADSDVLFVIARQGIMAVKRPAFGAEGNVIDHYSPAVIEKFIKEIGEPAIAATAPNFPYAIFCDSLEIDGENWTPTLLEEFKKRRGYDLRPLLPALFNDNFPKALDIRHDWLRTCTEMLNENFNVAFKNLAAKYGSKYRIQGYGFPPAALHSFATADLNEAEGYDWQLFDEARWASSASHLLGRPVTSSETWTWLHSPVFRATPLDMKGEADRHFLQGINQFIGHGWPYTAEGSEYPGWSFYAAGAFNEKNPWWIVMPDVAKYMQRVSHMMRHGTPANDVLVYFPNSDGWAARATSLNRTIGPRLGAAGGGARGNRGAATQPANNITGSILAGGYNLDYFDDQLLEMHGQVQGNTIAFGDLKYRAVVLPLTERIMPATMKKLEEFARGGGIVIAVGAAPQRAPGYQATEQDTQTVREIGQRLFNGERPPGKIVLNASEIPEMLAGKRLQPDVTFDPDDPDIGFVHRHTEDAEIYFIANTSNQPQKVTARFRVSAMVPEIWDPMSGKVSPVNAAGSTVNLHLPEYGSTIVVFTKRTLPTPPPVVASNAAALDIGTGWTVRFGAAGQLMPMEKLISWTADEKTRNFSGVATYEKTITVPEGMIKDGVSISLDFGEPRIPQAGGRRGMGYRVNLDTPIREAAVVYINNTRAGSLWSPPYLLNVAGLIKPGENQIRIEVANLAINQMAARGYPNYNLAGVRQVYGNRFDPQDLNLIEPLPSGLLGPVHLVPGETP